MSEEQIFSQIEKIVQEVSSLKAKGKNAILSLAEHVKQKHSNYLAIKEQRDLQIILEFFGIQVLVKAEIPLGPPLGKQKIIGKLIAYKLPEREPEREKYKPTQLSLAYDFDEDGNMKDEGSLNIHSFPIYFVMKLIKELVAKKIPIS